jgi:hypothetical protein
VNFVGWLSLPLILFPSRFLLLFSDAMKNVLEGIPQASGITRMFH